jgi:CheY-like chemotaxis protein
MLVIVPACDFGTVKGNSFLACLQGKRNQENRMATRPVILCVEDEWNGLEERATLFEERGYKVLVATSGEEALQVLASNPIDLVLLDYQMPEATGDVIAESMKASQPDIPIAMLSADEQLPESALEWVDAFISKSESPGSLLEIVEHLLDVRFLFAPFGSEAGGRQRRIA